MYVTIATAMRPTIASKPSCWRCGRFWSTISSTAATTRHTPIASATPAHIQRSASLWPLWCEERRYDPDDERRLDPLAQPDDELHDRQGCEDAHMWASLI